MEKSSKATLLHISYQLARHPDQDKAFFSFLSRQELESDAPVIIKLEAKLTAR
jgi:hypothetical protein